MIRLPLVLAILAAVSGSAPALAAPPTPHGTTELTRIKGNLELVLGWPLTLTEEPVSWAAAVRHDLLMRLADRNNRSRSVAAQILCNLAKSDPPKRMLRDFPALFAVTRDERFVTARHCLRSLWKVGCVVKEHQGILVSALERHFSECVKYKGCTLIRHDIIESLRRLFDAVHDDAIQGRALALIELETDPKYKKKYLSLWPKRSS